MLYINKLLMYHYVSKLVSLCIILADLIGDTRLARMLIIIIKQF